MYEFAEVLQKEVAPTVPLQSRLRRASFPGGEAFAFATFFPSFLLDPPIRN